MLNDFFSERSTEKELIDLGPNYYTQTEYQQCMQKLFTVNKCLGFFKTTVRLLKKLKNVHSVMDVGCGSGEFLLELSRYFPTFQLKGVDISSEAIQLAQEKLNTTAQSNVHFELQTGALKQNSVDIIITTLVCHHLEDQELILFLCELFNAARSVVIINDLHRHVIAYYLYRLISPIFRNRLITHDGLISIKRGFIKQDWQMLLKQAKIHSYQIQWKFPFRWSLVLWKK
jgi:2-polyprenyl-3-methyl-5-hydroxy-6-metoxy-1,4-benzoquinol methylase